MKVDVVILSDAKTDELRLVTQQGVNSCAGSDKSIDFNIIVIEQVEGVTYDNCQVHYSNDPFNYNKFLNKGISLGSGKFVALCNNDLVFNENWCSIIIEGMNKYNLLSACPVCPHVQPHRLVGLKEEVYFGYRNSYEVSGWCIMINRNILKIIGKLNEDFPFWFADNAYSEQLKSHNIPHGLISKSVVEHLGSRTLNKLEQGKKDGFTTDQIKRFVEAHPENESAVHFKQSLGL